MRTSLLILLGFAILAVALAAKPKKKSRDVDNSATEVTQKDENTAQEQLEPEVSKGSESADDVEENNKKSKGNPKGKPKPGDVSESTGEKKSSPSSSKSKKAKSSENSADNASLPTHKSKKNSKAESAKNPSKKASKKEVDDIISEDLEDILKDDSEDEDVEIPSPDELTTESSPIELGEQIRNITDKKKRRALIAQLKKEYIKNKGTLPGKFYQAAYASLSSAEGAAEMAEEFWNDHLEKATEKVKTAGKNIIGKANGGLGDALGNARKIAQIDPVGIALRRGESVLLNALSESLKNLGKFTDFAYDATKNGSQFIRAATFPVDFIPIASDIKNNVHELIEEGADRGKYLSGTFAENGSTAFANAAKNAGRKADEKEELLRQFTSTRTL